MLRDEGPIKQQEDHYRLAEVPVQGCTLELKSLHEWLQQEATAVKSRADILESTAKTAALKWKIRTMSERARAIDLKDLPQFVTNAESAIQAVKNKEYNHVLEAPSMLYREMIPLRNLANELYRMRETLNDLQTDDPFIDFEDDEDDD